MHLPKLSPQPAMRSAGSIRSGCLALLLVVFAAGCGDDDSANSSSPLIITTADLISALATDPKVILLSAQTVLESSEPGFVEDAAALDDDEWQEFSLSAEGFSSLADWGARFGVLGIDNASRVIVYDNGALKFAARARFLMSHFGVRQAQLLNGGFAALQPLIASGQLTQRTEPFQPPTRAFSAFTVDTPIRLVFKQDVAAVLGDPTVAIVDVRTPQEYAGEVTLPGDARPGHIPGALNLPVGNLFEASNPTLLDSPSGLLTKFQAAGLEPTGHVIVYCHDGAKSALAAAALVDAGYVNVSLYYDSYQDWSKDSALPIES